MSKTTVFKSDEKNTKDLITEFFILNDYFTTKEQELIKKTWELLVKKSETVETEPKERGYIWYKSQDERANEMQSVCLMMYEVCLWMNT
jgi:hypothetical protein